MKRRYLIATIVALAAVGAVLFLAAARGGKGEKVGDPFTVRKGDVTSFTEQTGILKAQVGAIVKVGTRATGTLMQLKYQVGDRVKKGDLIARIDDREILANMRNVEAQIEEQKRDLDARKAQQEYNRLNHEREQRLFSKEYTTRDNVDKAKRELDVGAAQVELARARVKEAEEKLKALEVSLSYTRIYAPITGYVSQVTTQEGETVVAGLSAAILITVIDPTKLEMWIYVDETDVGRVKPGMAVEYWVDAFRDRRFKGLIDSIYPQPEIRDNIVYYLAIVKIAPEDTSMLRPEMTTHVRIIVEQKKNVLVVPNGAVRFEDGKNVVYGGTKERPEKREVTTGTRDDRFTEIVSGLTEGEGIFLPAMKKAAQSGAKK